MRSVFSDNSRVVLYVLSPGSVKERSRDDKNQSDRREKGKEKQEFSRMLEAQMSSLT